MDNGKEFITIKVKEYLALHDAETRYHTPSG
jgi:hypothetical protein